MIIVQPADPGAPAIAALIAQLDAYQLSLYPRQFCHLDPVEELARANVYFVAAYHGENLLGCGAIKYPRNCSYAEIKRMFVVGEARGRGVSKKIMASLEAHAVQKFQQTKCDRICLETGIHQTEAIGLYKRLGYRRRGPFGDYPDDPMSVFMEKRLSHGDSTQNETTPNVDAAT